MKQDGCAMRYDPALCVEACRFSGLSQPFPNHFHEYYVIGLLERGNRHLLCNGRSYDIRQGDLLLFRPGDNHACTQQSGSMDYRSLHLSPAVLSRLMEKETGRQGLPRFSQTVIQDVELSRSFVRLHTLLLDNGSPLETGALLRRSLSLLSGYHQPNVPSVPEGSAHVEAACAYLKLHFAEHITLEQLCRHVGLSKSSLLRAFTHVHGITPHRYLQAVRVNQAKALLERGLPPGEAAAQAGFADQSHLTHAFRRTIGLTPGAYRDMLRACPSPTGKKD